MHFNYDLYTKSDFFIMWVKTIMSTMNHLQYLLLLITLLICIWYLIKGTRIERFFIFVYPFSLVLLVLNPYSAWFWESTFHIESRFFRIFWLLPIIIINAYAFTQLFLKLFHNCQKYVFLFSLLLLAFSSFSVAEATKYSFTGLSTNTGMMIQPTIYKIDSETVELADFIKKDSNDQFVNLICNYPIAFEIRQYNGKIILPQPNALEASCGLLTPEIIDSLVIEDKWQMLLLYLAIDPSDPNNDIYNDIYIDNDILATALSHTDTDYVILWKGLGEHRLSLWETIGHIQFETSNYYLIKIH